jgi:hypothetical protein
MTDIYELSVSVFALIIKEGGKKLTVFIRSQFRIRCRDPTNVSLLNSNLYVKWENGNKIFFSFSTENFEGKCITFLSGDPLLKMLSIILSYPKSIRKGNLLDWPSKVLKAMPFWPADFFFNPIDGRR